MTDGLHIGTTPSGKPFVLPKDYAVQTGAIVAVKGAGKTCTATVIAEELCKAHLPWICFDPVGVWWGMRVDANGKPGGWPVVVIGGEHGDLPLERTAGARIAEALIAEHVFAVIDLSQESKRFWHTFLSEFCLTLMTLAPDVPRHLFVEEAPEFIPQRTKVDLTARCKEAIERLVRLGRNKGYGCTIISQRPATVDKDVLSQCEQLFVMRTVGPHDRKALNEWIEAQASARKLDEFWKDLAVLPSGTAWFWSPHWLNRFEKVTIRERLTYHPGATRQVGRAVKSATMSEVHAFVEKLKRQLSKKQVIAAPATSVVGRGKVEAGTGRVMSVEVDGEKLHALAQEVGTLRTQLADERRRSADLERKLAAVRGHLKPQYDALKTLFGELGDGASASGADLSVYTAWLEKAGGGGSGRRRMLEVVIEKGELSRTQLATLAGLSPSSGSYATHLSWLKSNGLIEYHGGLIRLRPLA